MNYGDLETEITLRLRAYFTAFKYMDAQDVEKPLAKLFDAFEFPEDAKQMDRPFNKSTVFVQYVKSAYATVQSINQVSQTETIFIHFVFNASFNRGLGGLYELIHYTKSSLIGYKYSKGGTRLVMDDGPTWEQYENGSIKMGMQMKFDRPVTQAFNDDETPVGNLTQTNFI